MENIYGERELSYCQVRASKVIDPVEEHQIDSKQASTLSVRVRRSGMDVGTI